MEALSAFISIISIIAIVVVVGGLIAFVGHMVIGIFDGNKQSTKTKQKETMDYSQYKQFENSQQAAYNKEYDFEAINASKAKKEKEMLEKEKESFFDLEEDKDEDLEEIEERLKQQKSSKKETKKPSQEPVEVFDYEENADDFDDELDLDDFNFEEDITNAKTESEGAEQGPKTQSTLVPLQQEKKVVQETKTEQLEEEDDLDLDDMLSEISEEVIEEEKAENSAPIQMSEDLEKYSLSEMMAEMNEEVAEEATEDVSDEDVEMEDIEQIRMLPYRAKKAISLLPTTPAIPAVSDSARNQEIEDLKAQLAELNRQLELAKSTKVEVVNIGITEEECVQKIEMLEERLKNVKKDYKINMKEYRPLKKVMNDLERYQTKLRRKEAVVAKKKVALYGVNNYVDIDKEKAEKLANELELLDGLRLSVNHCEEVINANKDRFPILEHSNQILEDQISHLEADLAAAQETLRKIRERNGSGNNDSDNK